MNRDDIINLAREAGFKIKRFAGPDGQFPVAQRSDGCWVDVGSELAEFAELVAAAEREQCAQVCELIDTSAFGTERPAPNDCAAAIRARGNA